MDTSPKNQTTAEEIGFSNTAGPATTVHILNEEREEIRDKIKIIAEETNTLHFLLDHFGRQDGTRMIGSEHDEKYGKLLFNISSLFETFNKALETFTVTPKELESLKELSTDTLSVKMMDQLTRENGDFSKIAIVYARDLHRETEGFKLITDGNLTDQVPLEDLGSLYAKYKNIIDQRSTVERMLCIEHEKYVYLNNVIRKYDIVLVLESIKSIVNCIRMQIADDARMEARRTEVATASETVVNQAIDQPIQQMAIQEPHQPHHNVEVVSSEFCGCSSRSSCTIL